MTVCRGLLRREAQYYSRRILGNSSTHSWTEDLVSLLVSAFDFTSLTPF